MHRLTRFLSLAVTLGVALSVPAWAEPAEGEESDIAAEIQKQMEKIIRLMEESERALLALSAGGKERPKAVPVEVDPPEQPPAAGESAEKALDELAKKQRSAAGSIPDELAELVRMVPL